MNKTSNSTESTNSIPDEIKSLLTLGKYSDNVELNGKRDSLSIIKKNQKFLFPKCRILSVSYSTFSEDSTFLSLNKKEILKLIDLIEDSPILKNGDSLSNYGVNDNTKEKYAKLCIVYENSHGDLQNVSLNTFKGDILHFYDFNGEDYRIGPNKQLVDFIIKHTGYRVLPATAFDKIYDRIKGYMQAAEVGNQVLKNLADRSGIPIQTGVQKLTEVLSKIKIDCMTEGIEYDEKYWVDKIEELIKFSKVVNAK